MKLFILFISLLSSLTPSVSFAEQAAKLPSISIDFNGILGSGSLEMVKIILMVTIFSLAPAILVMMTSFTRIVVVLYFLRQALSTQQVPSNQLIVGLSIFLSIFVMAPTFSSIHESAVVPYTSKKISQEEAIKLAEIPVRDFMLSQTREKDLSLFVELSGQKSIKDQSDIKTWMLIPAFIISELKTAFQIGFVLYLPFLIIDMVVASVLMAMGMMMLPPFMISLPFKILLFVLVDGWELVIGSLVRSFG